MKKVLSSCPVKDDQSWGSFAPATLPQTAPKEKQGATLLPNRAGASTQQPLLWKGFWWMRSNATGLRYPHAAMSIQATSSHFTLQNSETSPVSFGQTQLACIPKVAADFCIIWFRGSFIIYTNIPSQGKFPVQTHQGVPLHWCTLAQPLLL